MPDSVQIVSKGTAVGDPPFHVFREKEASLLAEKLLADRFVAVLGSSGDGKSSFVLGSLPRVFDGGQLFGKEGSRWKMVVTMPFDDPIGNLASDLAKPGGIFPFRNNEINFKEQIAHTLREGPDGIVQVYRQAKSAAEGESFNLLLVVDQKQELYRFDAFMREAGRAGDDARYINLLLNAYRSNEAIYVVFVSDTRYMEYFSKFRGLPEALNNYRFNLPLLSSETISDFYQENLPETTTTGLREAIVLAIKEYKSLIITGILQDPFALQKFNLRIKFQQRKGHTNMPALPLAIRQFIEQEVYEPLNAQEKISCQLIFKTLVTQSGNGIYQRQPAKLGYILGLVNRQEGLNADLSMICAILKRFNVWGESFIRFVGPREQSADTIVDIDSDSLLYNWPTLTNWVDEELLHAEIYKNIVRDAYLYFTTDPSDPLRKDMVYEGIYLTSAINWRDKCRPNRLWAERYQPKPPELNPEQKKRLELAFKTDRTEKLNNLDIALDFLSLCISKYQDKLQEKEYQIKAAQRQKRNAFLLASCSVLLGVIAIVFLLQSIAARRNIELLDFVEELNYNNVLAIEKSNEYEEIKALTAEVVKTKTIDNEQMVVSFLTDRQKIYFDPDALSFKPSYIESLLNIGRINLERKQGIRNQRALNEIEEIYKKIAALDPANKWQHAYLYHALNAHLYELGAYTTIESSHAALIEESALTKNPAKGHEFAIGTKNGVLLLNRHLREILIDSLGSVISSSGFSGDGRLLYVGTESGQVYQYDHLELPDGTPPEARGKRAIYKFNQPVYLAAGYKKTDYVLAVTENVIYFLTKGDGVNAGKIHAESAPIQLKRISFTECTPDQSYLLASGKDATFIYFLNPDDPNPSQRIVQCGQINHPGVTILKFDVRFDTINGQTLTHLALGSEQGDIWVAQSYEAILRRWDLDVGEALFYKKDHAHESAITGLAFNPVRQQLASSGYDGIVKLWNLDKIKTPYDHIKLLNYGQTISSLVFLNEGELVAYETMNGWLIYSGIHELYHAVQCAKVSKGNCRYGTH